MNKGYEDLLVWQKGIDLCEEVYTAVKQFPKEETYGLSDQMRRAVVSIPSNIAEGQAGNSLKDFIKYLNIAKGSNAELKTQLIIANRLHYISDEQTERLIGLSDEIGKMISALINKLTADGR